MTLKFVGELNITPENIVAAVHAASATGRIALTVLDKDGKEQPTNVAHCFVRALLKNPSCSVPPEGWHCTRTPGHEGPCAAYRKLRPCPFCRSQVTLLTAGISCDGCLCTMERAKGQSDDELVEAWNTRG